MLELVQQIITKLAFVRTFNITYMGQMITCSYKLPEAFSHESMMDMDGTTTESKSKTLSLDIEVETNIPIYNPQTIMNPASIISKTQYGIIIKNTNEID